MFKNKLKLNEVWFKTIESLFGYTKTITKIKETKIKNECSASFFVFFNSIRKKKRIGTK